MKKYLSFLWIISASCLIFYYNYKGVSDPEYLLSLIFIMSILTFPLGLIATLVGYGALAAWELGTFGEILIWISFIAIGYFQWFVLLPKLIIRNKKP